MPSRPRLTPKEILRIKALIAEGAGDAEIARTVGRHRSSVTKIRLGAIRRSVTTGGRQLQVRLSEEEFDAFSGEAERLGLSRSAAGRRLVRKSVGVLDLDGAEIEALHKLRIEINALGRNLNQLVTLAQSGRLKWARRDERLLRALDEKVEEATNEIVALVSASRKRAYVLAVFPPEGLIDG